jgi:hypothetical protein
MLFVKIIGDGITYNGDDLKGQIIELSEESAKAAEAGKYGKIISVEPPTGEKEPVTPPAGEDKEPATPPAGDGKEQEPKIDPPVDEERQKIYTAIDGKFTREELFGKIKEVGGVEIAFNATKTAAINAIIDAGLSAPFVA